MKDTEWLTPAWLQRMLDALRDSLAVEPELRKQMIEFLRETGLWESRATWDNAVTRFQACLNAGNPSTFKLVEVLALMKRFQRHQLFLAIAEDLGYEVRLKPTEERRQELLERVARALEANHRSVVEAAEELARTDPGARALRLHPAIVEGSASFDFPEDPGASVGRLSF